jgi:hypothetical protein
MPRGILWVSSRVVEKEKLTGEAFCAWYEDVSISLCFPWCMVVGVVRCK